MMLGKSIPVPIALPTALKGLIVSAAVCALVILAGAPVASAQSPWWHLSLGSRPAPVQPGSARDQVQEIVTSPEVAFRLTVNGQNVELNGNEGIFVTEPFFKEFGELFPEATAANVQVALEGVYGAGNVIVTGGPAGAAPLVVRIVGEKADTSVPRINATALLGLPGEFAEAKLVVGGRPDGQLVISAANLGDGPVDGESTPVSIADQLPAGYEAIGIEGFAGGRREANDRGPVLCSLESLTCTFKGTLPSYLAIEVVVDVLVKPGTPTGELNHASVSGGQTPAASVTRAVQVSSTPGSFGVEAYEMLPEEEGGELDTQAGSHPFQLTTNVVFNQGFKPNRFQGEELQPKTVDLAKDLNFKLPPGLIGNPTPIPKCTLGQFLSSVSEMQESVSGCPAETAVGVANVSVNDPHSAIGLLHFLEPVFNLEPAVGEPARFAFKVLATPVILDTSVRTGGDYGVTVSVSNIAQVLDFTQSQVTFWGVPGDPRHDSVRGYGCLAQVRGLPHILPCNPAGEQHPPPFLAMPTACPGKPLVSEGEGDSWGQAGSFLAFSNTEPMATIDGCNRLPFGPHIEVTPDGTQASKPTGLNVDVHVPQDLVLNPTGLAQSNVKDISVALPEGVVLNPAAADGLEACSEGLIGFEGFSELHPVSEPGLRTAVFTPGLPSPLAPGVNFCPNAAKVGTVKIKSPLLPADQPLEGAVYLATPAPFGEEGNNPFNSTVAMYIVAKDPVSGTLVKLPGRVTLDQQTGRIVGTFENTPQLAFEDAELHFFGGERAPLATPARCGTYTTEATFTPWSGNEPVKSTSSFQVTSGPDGSPCPGASLPFTPTLAAGSPNINAGSFSPLTTTISRADGNQNIQTVQLHMAPGMSGILAGVPLCGEAQANAGTCSPASLIGETIVSVGLGGDPFTVTGGKVYLTEKYGPGAFGLSIVNPADAGPFHLGKVIVRASIQVDPTTAQLTITTGQIPHIIKGFPLQIKHVNVVINRPGFTFNPTNCNAQSITGTIGSVEGASSPVSVPFQVTNCATLAFKPDFKVSVSGKTSKAGGAALSVKLAYPKAPFGSQANIAKVKVELPVQLPSRLTTLQKACLSATFEANPANCPGSSIVGHAKVITPLLPVPLEGPAYFVSHGGEAFPSLTIVLKGYGVTVDLVGTTFINRKGITSTTFKSTPDVPFDTFELKLPQGPYSALTANTNLCAATKLQTVKRRVAVHEHGRAVHRLRKVRRRVPASLAMPTEFIAQNGAAIHQSTKIAVTGCEKHKSRRAGRVGHGKKGGRGKR
jgi:hypothetical protein